MTRDQRNLLSNYLRAMREPMIVLEDWAKGDTEKKLRALKQLETLARNARVEIGNMELQQRMEV